MLKKLFQDVWEVYVKVFNFQVSNFWCWDRLAVQKTKSRLANISHELWVKNQESYHIL